MTPLLAFKLLVTPLLIVAVSLAGRRWGPAVSGWLLGLPLTSAPVSIFLAIENGNAFSANAANGTLLGLLALSAFTVVYTLLARRDNWWLCLAGGWSAYIGVAALLNFVHLPPLATFVVVMIVLVGALKVVQANLGEKDSAQESIPIPRWDLPARIIIATGFVVGLTTAANFLGPQLSGLISPFPVFATILAVFAHRLSGQSGAVQVLRGVVNGDFSFALFFLIVALLIEPLGIVPTFALATVATLALHGLSLRTVR